MFSEPLTLYKLMILYMLRQARFQLTNSQISEFFLQKNYTNYFTLQQALNELLDAHLLKQETIRNSSRYEITREGEETLNYFSNKISETIIADINDFLKENRIRLRNEVGVISDYHKTSSSEYMVECEVREGKNTVVKLSLSVPTLEQAELICDRWKESNQQVYDAIIKELLKD